MKTTNLTKGSIRVRELHDAYSAEQWTGTHWTLLHVTESKDKLNFWLDHVWHRPMVDNRASD